MYDTPPPIRPPYAWLNAPSRAYLSEDYLLKGTGPEARIEHIGHTAERINGIPGFANKFVDYMSRGWYSLASPIWSNFGLDRGLPISCFGSYVTDCMESILAAHAEIGMMSKFGGGTSLFMTNIRPRGSDISNNGKSHGSVHFAELFDLEIRIISQGSSRRGEAAAYWDIDHRDVMEALRIRTLGHPIQKLSYGLCVRDAWLEDMIAGDPEKRAVWAKVIETRKATGYPYLFFVDTANRNAPQVYKDLGMRINHSNLCVTGDHLVPTSHGLLSVKELNTEVYGAKERAETTDGKKGVSAGRMQLIKKGQSVTEIVLSNGMKHTVTSDHKVPVVTSMPGWRIEYENVPAEELKRGMRVMIQTEPGPVGPWHYPGLAFEAGLEHNRKAPERERYEVPNDQNTVTRRTLRSDRLSTTTASTTGVTFSYGFYNNAYQVYRIDSEPGMREASAFKPILPDTVRRGDRETQYAYLDGLMGTNNFWCTADKGDVVTGFYLSGRKYHLSEVQVMLANLGIQSSVEPRKGGHVLCVESSNGIVELATRTRALGLADEVLELDPGTLRLPNRYAVPDADTAEIVSIEHAGYDDVYCWTVDSEEHHWVCGGVVTHNCTEISLPNTPDESFVCCVSSVNDLYYDEWKDTDAVEVMVQLLDAVISEFLTKARGVYGMDRAVRFAERHRALGIGQLGWHGYLQSKMIPFASMEAMRENVRIAKTIKEAAHAASAKMARTHGEPLYMKGRGMRHTTLTAIAPTKSSSFILGQSSAGIDPYVSNLTVKDLQKIKHTVFNPHLERLLDERGRNTPEVRDAIMKAGGSVLGLPFLNDHEKDVFRTYIEIEPAALVRQAAQRQPYVDQSQSLNLIIDPQVPAKEVNALYLDAWRTGVISLYYQDNVSAAQQLTQSLTACRACEG